MGRLLVGNGGVAPPIRAPTCKEKDCCHCLVTRQRLNAVYCQPSSPYKLLFSHRSSKLHLLLETVYLYSRVQERLEIHRQIQSICYFWRPRKDLNPQIRSRNPWFCPIRLLGLRWRRIEGMLPNEFPHQSDFKSVPARLSGLSCVSNFIFAHIFTQIFFTSVSSRIFIAGFESW